MRPFLFFFCFFIFVSAFLPLMSAEKANPCENFYQYACQEWEDKTPLPPDRAFFAKSFTTIQEGNLEILRTILEKDKGDLGTFYQSCMDEKQIELQGKTLVVEELQKVDHITPSSLPLFMAGTQLEGNDCFFELAVVPDFKNPTKNILFVDQGGLGLPDRDYYLMPDKAKILEQYKAHIITMLKLTGMEEKEAKQKAVHILKIEQQLAKASLDKVVRRDPYKVYHFVSKETLSHWTPHFAWEPFFGVLNTPSFSSLNVAVPNFVQEVDKILGETPLEEIKDYLKWHRLNFLAGLLGGVFEKENFHFYKETLLGQKKQLPRWKRCLQTTEGLFKDLLGQKFVQEAFKGKSKEEILLLVKNITMTFQDNLTKLKWMDEGTRETALKKLKAMRYQLGYPDEWKEIPSGVSITSSYFKNVMLLERFWVLKTLKDVEQNVDPQKWEMTIPMVNAYYDPLSNKMAFPAGILRPSFFSIDQTAAQNYGGIGSVIGHEMTHGFDDQGRQFDEKGQLRDWWSDKTKEIFRKEAEKLEEQFSNYTISGVAVNGSLTLGENIADLGGLKLAFGAYKRAYPNASQKEEQEFFVAFAQNWCFKATAEVEKLKATTDPHSPPRYRVNGTVQNMEEFSKAFNCKEGSALSPKTKREIW